ncbi:MAG: LicD family protein [Ruminococcus sp.]|nr:LicD family protein [Ruminococcus sp.]
MNIDSMLPKVKQVELEILTVVDEFCKKNDIKYSLAYGTLLGAVRHKGFIPWDDDIDIFMPREDYNRFLKLWKESPPTGYILQNIDTDFDYRQSFTKIRKDNTAYLQKKESKKSKYHKGIFIDVFPLDKVAISALSQKKQKVCAVFMMLFTRGYIPADESGLVILISKLALKIVPQKKYETVRKILERKVIKAGSQSGGYKFFGSMMSLKKNPYPPNMFESIVELEFEEKSFSATKIWDRVLTTFYGDYMKLPPVQERVWSHSPVYIDFNKNYSND